MDTQDLVELEPSPVDEYPPDSAEGYFPQDGSTAPPTILGLRLHSIAYYLLRIQKYSSYTFTVFTALHITNTSLLPLATNSVSTSTTYLLLTRPYYQSTLAEPLLVLLPLGAHIASGLLLRLHRRHVLINQFGAARRRKDREGTGGRLLSGWPKVSLISMLGYAAVPLVIGHAALNRLVPLIVEGGSSGVGLDFVGHGVAMHPVSGFVGFSALVGVVGWHVLWGWAKWLGLLPEQAGGVGASERKLKRKRRWWGINAASAAFVAAWLAGGLGIVARNGKVEGWVGRAYDEMYRRVPMLGSLP